MIDKDKSETATRSVRNERPARQQRQRRFRARILVVCDDEKRLDSIVGCMGQLNVESVAAPWHEYVERLADCQAMIVAEPLPVAGAAAVAAVRGHPDGGRLPLYVIVGDATSARRVRSLYASGATAVFAWPSEARSLPDLLAETFGMAKVRGRAKRPDVALGRTIRAHLRVGPRPGASVKVSVRRGTVVVSGETRTLARKKEIVEAVSAVPGVTRIDATALRVANLGVSDKSIEKDVRNVASRMSEIDPEELSIDVQNGRVELGGHVSSPRQILHLIELIENVKGVRKLKYTLEIEGGRPTDDHLIRQRLRKAIDALFPGEGAGVSIFEGVAVLSGTVRSLPAKQAIERLASRERGVRRVVNKLEVRGGS